MVPRAKIKLFLNFRLGERQIKNLLKIAAFSKDKDLRENSQAEMKEQCLKLWQVSVKIHNMKSSKLYSKMYFDIDLLSYRFLMK